LPGSAYDHDPRVTSTDTGYTIDLNGTVYHVLHAKWCGWGIYTGPNLDMVPTTTGGFAIGYPAADDAIRALIGDPEN